MPELQALADHYRDRGVELVTVVMNGSMNNAVATARRLGLTAPVLMGTSQIRRDFRIDAVPWTVIIDRSGKPVAAMRGAHGQDTFRQAVEKHL